MHMLKQSNTSGLCHCYNICFIQSLAQFKNCNKIGGGGGLKSSWPFHQWSSYTSQHPSQYHNIILSVKSCWKCFLGTTFSASFYGFGNSGNLFFGSISLHIPVSKYTESHPQKLGPNPMHLTVNKMEEPIISRKPEKGKYHSYFKNSFLDVGQHPDKTTHLMQNVCHTAHYVLWTCP